MLYGGGKSLVTWLLWVTEKNEDVSAVLRAERSSTVGHLKKRRRSVWHSASEPADQHTPPSTDLLRSRCPPPPPLASIVLPWPSVFPVAGSSCLLIFSLHRHLRALRVPCHDPGSCYLAVCSLDNSSNKSPWLLNENRLIDKYEIHGATCATEETHGGERSDGGVALSPPLCSLARELAKHCVLFLQ